MRTRLKEVRKAKHLTQSQLADAIHVSKSTIEAYEYGRTDVTDRSISDICRLYGVNETWLRTGKGDMFAPLDREQEIAQIVSSVYKEDDAFRRELIKCITELDDLELKKLKEFIKRLAKEI